MVEINSTWDGTERRKGDRRECLLHSRHEVLIDSFQRRLKTIDDRDYVPMSTLKWIVGSVIGIFITLFSISLYTAQGAVTALNEIKVQQKTTITIVEGIKDDIAEVKLLHKEEIQSIKTDINTMKRDINLHERLH